MLRKQALIAITALGLTMGSGATLAAPVGTQGLAGATLQQTGATIEPVHFKKRRHFHARSHFVHPRRHAFVFVHPGFHKRHFVRRHHFVHPHFVRRHHFHRHHFHARPRVHFGLSFGF